MANDNTTKTNSSGNSENKSISNIDQQKVPPLRIVLNTAGNQKSSAATVTFNSNHKKEKTQDVKTDVGTLKSGSKVRIKLGVNKQQTAKGSGCNSDSSSNPAGKVTIDGAQKLKNNSTEDKQDDTKDDTSLINQSHLRRITRRSQRAVQSVSNEDEESISSMTSTDENLNTNNTNSSDNNSAQDTEQSNNTPAATSTTTTTTTSTATNGSSSIETPRRYKRRKGEVSESLSIDNDSLFGSQNYKLPNQNSFELYKNIRKQVDRKITSLSTIHPRAPYGFRDYMLTRGAYLLDGNKLGNGTNLFMGEDGGLHSIPMGKYHAFRRNRVNYSIPNRAKVPLGLPVNSPLYDLFIEQERERYRMRMQHIKEREKLTLAAEQEIMRVYNNASLIAVNQTEPFSACTMLKHQEIYNYLDSDGSTILCREDSHREQTKPDRVRTRRRPQGQASPPPTQGGKVVTDESSNPGELNKKEHKDSANVTTSCESFKAPEDQPSNEVSTESAGVDVVKEEESGCKDVSMIDSEQDSCTKEDPQKGEESNETLQIKDEKMITDEVTDKSDDSLSGPTQNTKDAKTTASVELEQKLIGEAEKGSDSEMTKSKSPEQPTTSTRVEVDSCNDNKTSSGRKGSAGELTTVSKTTEDSSHNVASEAQAPEAEANTQSPESSSQSISDEERKAEDREAFLLQLQEIDDKWDKIRHEMLIRHRNEAESLHAIQKLEWEWKTKEIGACDVRTTPVIDSTLVPKLNIYSQDY